eukprot:6463340-Amphidinium_carterae.1
MNVARTLCGEGALGWVCTGIKDSHVDSSSLEVFQTRFPPCELHSGRRSARAEDAHPNSALAFLILLISSCKAVHYYFGLQDSLRRDTANIRVHNLKVEA